MTEPTVGQKRPRTAEEAAEQARLQFEEREAKRRRLESEKRAREHAKQLARAAREKKLAEEKERKAAAREQARREREAQVAEAKRKAAEEREAKRARKAEEREAEKAAKVLAHEMLLDELREFIESEEWCFGTDDIDSTLHPKSRPVYTLKHGFMERVGVLSNVIRDTLGNAARFRNRVLDDKGLSKTCNEVCFLSPKVTPIYLLYRTPTGVIDLRDPLNPVFPYTPQPDEVCGTKVDFEIAPGPTDVVDQMMVDQNWTKLTMLWWYATMGQLLYPSHSLEHWEMLPFFLGAPGTGKSTMQDFVIGKFFNPNQVVMVSDQGSDVHQLASLARREARLVPFTEVSGKRGGISRERLSNIATGETVPIREMHQSTQSVKITVKPLGAGNFIFGGTADTDFDVKAMTRRFMIFPFYNVPAKRDNTLGARLQAQAGAVLWKAVTTFGRVLDYMNRNGIKDHHFLLSGQILTCAEQLEKKENTFYQFLQLNVVELESKDTGYDRARGNIWQKEALTYYKIWAARCHLPSEVVTARSLDFKEALESLGYKQKAGQKGGVGQGSVRLWKESWYDNEAGVQHEPRLAWKTGPSGKWEPVLPGAGLVEADPPKAVAMLRFFQS